MLFFFSLWALLLTPQASVDYVLPDQATSLCGFQPGSHGLTVNAKMVKKARNIRSAPKSVKFQIETHVNVVTKAAKQGTYTPTQVGDQMHFLNQAFGGHGIAFTLNSTEFIVNDTWATVRDNAYASMSYSLHKGDEAALNLYYVSDMNTTENLGMSIKDLRFDGCFIFPGTLPVRVHLYASFTSDLDGPKEELHALSPQTYNIHSRSIQCIASVRLLIISG